MHLRDSELRLAMYQMFDFEARELIARQRVEIIPHPAADVHLYRAEAGGKMKRCFAWSIAIDARRVEAAVVPFDDNTNTAEKAVAAYRSR